MDNDGNKVTWSVIIIAAVASIGLMFVNFMPSQTANIKAAIGNELSSFINSNKSDSSSNKSSSSSSRSSSHTTIGTNLIIQSDLKRGYLDRGNGGVDNGSNDFHSDNYIATNGETVFTFSSPDYAFKGRGNDTLAMYDSNRKYLGYQLITSPTQTLSKSNVAYIRFSINFTDDGGTSGNLSDWLNTHRYKLEKGSKATQYTP